WFDTDAPSLWGLSGVCLPPFSKATPSLPSAGGRDARHSGRVDGQRGTRRSFDLSDGTSESISASPFPTVPLRTGLAPFSASGSPVTEWWPSFGRLSLPSAR